MDEVDEKLDRAQQELRVIVEKKEEAQRALSEAQDLVGKREEALASLLSDEGNQRRAIGELEKMRDAFEQTPKDHEHA